MNTILLQGSARTDGSTANIAHRLSQHTRMEVLHLADLDIHQFDYHHRHRGDDFLPLMRHIVTYDRLLIATPVYWYTMSGHVKVFLDRITDCLQIEKPIGRKLRGMHLAVLSQCAEASVPPGFFEPFRLSADYLGMHYDGDHHILCTDAGLDATSEQHMKRWLATL